MFDIFSKESGFNVVFDDAVGLEAINRLKESARVELKKYDELTSSPINSEVKRHFLENERVCFKSFLDNGFSLLILRRLLDTLPEKIKGFFSGLDSWEHEEHLFRGQIELTYLSINAVASIIDLLAKDGKIRLSEKETTPLSDDGYDFLNDGFDYICSPYVTRLIGSYEADATERIEAAIRDAERYFEVWRLTPEQNLYFSFEMQTLRIFLKDFLRGIAYQSLLTFDISADLLAGDKVLINNTLSRIHVVLDMILELSEAGIIRLESK